MAIKNLDFSKIIKILKTFNTQLMWSFLEYKYFSFVWAFNRIFLLEILKIMFAFIWVASFAQQYYSRFPKLGTTALKIQNFEKSYNIQNFQLRAP